MKRSILLLISALTLSWSVKAAETYTINWSANGNIVHSTEQSDGEMIVELPATPTACAEYGYTFVGWSDQQITQMQSEAPMPLYTDASEMPLVSGDVTYYAVFFSENGDGSSTSQVVDVLTLETTGVTGTGTYTSWSDISAASGTMYSGNSAGNSGAIQLRSSGNSSGIINTSTIGRATMISIEWDSKTSNGQTLNIYGSESPFGSVSDLYSSATMIGTITFEGTTSSTYAIEGSYPYIGLRSANGVLYLTNVSITWRKEGAGGTPGYTNTCGSSGSQGDDPTSGGDGGSGIANGELPGGQTWSLSEEGELYIIGGGNIEGYSSSNQVPWYNYRNQITSLYLNADFHSIGKYVFYGLTNLTTITCMSAYVPTLETNTFTQSMLTRITAHVRETLYADYQQASYWQQMNLETIPETGGNTGDPITGYVGDLFWQLTEDKSMLIIQGTGDIPSGSGDSHWSEYAGYIQSVSIEEGVEYIGDYAFYNLPQLSTLTMSATVNGIGDYSFYNCVALRTITCYATDVPKTGNQTFDEVDMSSVYLYVPEASISDYQDDPVWGETLIYPVSQGGGDAITGSMDNGLIWAFDANARQLTISGSGQMQDYEFEYDVPWYEYASQVDSVIVSEGITYIGNNAFYACSNLTKATFPRTTDSIGVNIFADHSQAFTLNLGAFIPPGITQETFSNVSGQLYTYVWQSLWGLYSNTPIWMNLMINSNDNPSDVEVMDVIDNQIVWCIGSGVLRFYGRGDIPNYTEASEQPWYDYRASVNKIYMESSSIAQIGSYAFEGCGAVNEVVLPPTLIYINNRSFGDCISLYELNACDVRDDYGFACDADAFAGVDMSAVTMHVPGTQQQEAYRGTEIFSACSFQICSGGSGETDDKLLDSGECGPSVTWELYESGLLVIKGSSYIYGYTYYEDIPWYNYRSQINKVEVQEGVESLTKAAFIDCIQMSSISLPSTLCCIDDSTFYNCVALRSITCIRDNPPSVNGEYPFGGVTLSNITLYVPEGASTMYSYADYWKEMTIEELSGGSVLQPYELQYIFINDIALDGFSPSLFNYDIVLPDGSATPRVTYMSGNINQSVEIEQPTSPNSTAYLHVSIDGERKATYTINFTCSRPQTQISLTHAWKFMMLPTMFDLTADDITVEGDVEWYTYDGEMRAAGNSGWVKVNDLTEVLDLSSQALIVRATGESATLSINVPEASQNPTEIGFSLNRNPDARHPENANWNFLGNPYNYEYNLSGLLAKGITSVIYVWNGTAYSTYNPEYDEYLLQPFEAFFLQVPDDGLEVLEFSPEYVIGYNAGGNTGGDTEEGALTGYFSVGEGVQVRFSKGNLQYYPLKDVWQFAENQYDYIGEANANISADYDGWIDLFGWGTGNNPTLATQNSEDYSTFTDWGNNPISNGGYMGGLWRTLTSDEWNYLLKVRTNATELYGFGSIDGIRGLILLPDSWSEDAGVTITTGTGNYSQNTLTAGDWLDFESRGAVFLPAAGNRNGKVFSGGGTDGYYWSTTLYNASNASALYFTLNSLHPQLENFLIYGSSVRLVRE